MGLLIAEWHSSMEERGMDNGSMVKEAIYIRYWRVWLRLAQPS